MKRSTLIALCAFVLFVLPAGAAKPVPTLVLSPNPTTPYIFYTVSGCGYPRSASFSLELERSWAYDLYFTVISDSSGCLRSPVNAGGYIFFQADAAGTSQEITIYHGSKILAHALEQTVA